MARMLLMALEALTSIPQLGREYCMFKLALAKEATESKGDHFTKVIFYCQNYISIYGHYTTAL